ncbi:MAG: CoA-binding protein, partial [Dehalococcoidales bacterium]|nr:CoA-binding protein [Dehalococcoidales bacterium]
MNSIELIFAPESVAVIGASNDPTKWGGDVFARLSKSHTVKRLYPVNSKETTVQGIKAYPSIRDVPEPVDLVAIIIPHQDLLRTIRDCAEKGVKIALIITAGLGETGEEGARAEREIVDIAHNAGMRLVGPNCMGHLNKANNFSTLRSMFPIHKGNIGV